MIRRDMKMPRKTTAKNTEVKCECNHAKDMCNGGAIYGLGFIGAAVYYISTATGFWDGVWGLVKALLWPAFLVFELLKYLHM